MNLSPLALSCSRTFLMQGGVYCLSWGGWALHFTSYLASLIFPSSREKITHRESSCQSLHSEKGTPPLSPGSGGTNGVCECKMDVKSTWILTWHRMDHVFMVTWTIFKNHLLEVGLTQNQETMALRTLTTVDLFYFIMCEDPHE